MEQLFHHAISFPQTEPIVPNKSFAQFHVGADANKKSYMTGAHNKIIAAAAKTELAPLGFRRLGQSRLWLADHGVWLNIVGFTPSRWSVAVQLDNAAHWIWGGIGFMSWDYSVRVPCSHAEFENADQFVEAVTGIARKAASGAAEIEKKFSSFEAIADFVIGDARGNERLRPSWLGYYAGIASGLLNNFGEAEQFLRGIADERVVPRAEPFLSVIDKPADFKSAVNDLVVRQRAALKLPALENDPF